MDGRGGGGGGGCRASWEEEAAWGTSTDLPPLFYYRMRRERPSPPALGEPLIGQRSREGGGEGEN